MPLFPRVYDSFMVPWEHGRLGRYRRAVVSGARDVVLEIGAETGLNFPHYDRAVAVVATDPTRLCWRALSHARPWPPRGSFASWQTRRPYPSVPRLSITPSTVAASAAAVIPISRLLSVWQKPSILRRV